MHNSFDMALFAKVVQLQSFSATAAYYNLSRSSVSKRISNLEKALGVRLLTRSTRHLHVTEAGAALFDHALRISQETEAGAIAASLYAAKPQGLVRLSCASAFGRLHVLPVLPKLLTRYPELSIEMIMTDRAVDLVRERIDIAITSDVLPGINLAVRRLAPITSFVCAADSYLSRHGTPRVPADLAQHNCISFRSSVTLGDIWCFRRDGEEVLVPIRGNFYANDHEGVREAAMQGLGIALLPTFVTEAEPYASTLRPLLTEFETPGLFDSHILLHYVSGSRTPPKVRTCVDFLADYFREIHGDLPRF